MRTLLFRGSSGERCTAWKLLQEAVLDELTHKTLLAGKHSAAVLHRFPHETDHLLSVGFH